jgi:hypothetical protein
MVNAPAQLQYRMTQRSVRPPRALTLICSDGDWRSDVLRMMECYSRTWGGDGNGLAACSDSGEIAEPFWPLLCAFDADHWLYFQRTRRGLRLADPPAYDALLAGDIARLGAKHGWSESDARRLLESDDYLSGGYDGPLVPAALDQRILRWFAPLASPDVAIRDAYKADEPPPPGLVDMCQLTYRPDQTTLLDVGRWPLRVQLLIASRTGSISPSHRTYLEEKESWVQPTISVGNNDLSQVLELAWTGDLDPVFRRTNTDSAPRDPELISGDSLAGTPLAQSRLGCSWLTKLRPGLREEPVVVICGDTAEDFCYAFTRQRVVGNTYWLPKGPGSADTELGRVLRQTLTRVLSRYSRTPSENRPILLSSLTLTAGDLDALLDELSRTIWGQSFNDGRAGSLNVRACGPGDLTAVRDVALLDQEHFADIRHEPFLGPELATTLDIPRPTKAEGLRPDSCRWQVDVLMPDHVLPARWCLDTIIGDQRLHWAVRSSTSGISVDSHGRFFQFSGSPLSQMLTQIRLRFPPASEVFATLLADTGTIHESDKGRYTRRMIELWGDLSALAGDLQGPPTRKLLTSWASDTIDGDLGRIHQRRKYLRLGDVMKIAGLHIDRARDLLDRYLAKGIVARGLVLQCGMCAGTSFYRLEDLGPGFRCQRCRQDNQIARQAWRGPREPQWFYGLDEVVYQGLDSNVQVPVVALAELAKPAKSFLYMPEALVRTPGHNDLEVDLWAIVDGKILIGEAKKSDKLETTVRREKARCTALRAVADAVTADQFVMATSSAQWNQRTRDSVTKLISPAVPICWMEYLDSQAQ